MVLMQIFLIILSALMIVIGGTFLILYFVNLKQVKKSSEEKLKRNNFLNLALGIIIPIGGFITLLVTFVIF